MTSASEIATNGAMAQNTNLSRSVSPTNTPKAKGVTTNLGEVNGHHKNGQTSLAAINGNELGDKAGMVEQTTLHTPPHVEGNGLVSEEGETRQNGTEEHNDEIPVSSGPKRDLYVGNLYIPAHMLCLV